MDIESEHIGYIEAQSGKQCIRIERGEMWSNIKVLKEQNNDEKKGSLKDIVDLQVIFLDNRNRL